MLQTILMAFDNTIIILNLIYSGCYIAGKLIFYLLLQVANLTFTFIKFMINNFHIILKEFKNFLEDLTIYLNWTVDSINKSIDSVIESYHKFENFINNFKLFNLNQQHIKIERRNTIWDSICWYANNFHQGLYLIGDTISWIINSIVHFILYSIKYIFDSITYISNIITMRHVTLNTIKRIPTQTLVAIIFTYVLIIHRRKIYKYLKMILILFWVQILKRIPFFPKFLLQQIFSSNRRNGRTTSNRTSSSSDWKSNDNSNRGMNNENPELLCLICQVETKCVVLLPCKHLCMCTKCSDNLRFYQEICPLCRSLVTNKMKIYV